eukprot:scpid82004/ scgid27532/ Protein tumorous imaginal discs, mitochondrial; Protein lethal(2)tumorous imaginal discs; TID58
MLPRGRSSLTDAVLRSCDRPVGSSARRLHRVAFRVGPDAVFGGGGDGGGCARYFSMSARLCRTHYETLGVTRAAKPGEIKTAFYDLSKKWHPDKHGGSKTATMKFQEISEAYGVLSNVSKRRDYDMKSGFSGGARPGGATSHASTSEQHWRRHHANQQHGGADPFNPFTRPGGTMPPHIRQRYYRERTQFNFDEWYRQHYGPDGYNRSGPSSPWTRNRRQRPEPKLAHAQEMRARLLAACIIIFIFSGISSLSRRQERNYNQW